MYLAITHPTPFFMVDFDFVIQQDDPAFTLILSNSFLMYSPLLALCNLEGWELDLEVCAKLPH